MKKLHLFLLALTLFCSFNMKAQFKEASRPDFYLQYIPLLADIGLGMVGVECNSTTLNRLVAAGLGYASEAIIVNSLKYTIREERPDNQAFNSFPSGHTATAFLGAELIRKEYGWKWGAAAYSLASGVAACRVAFDRHYWWDTVAGAGVGILSANIGYWLLKPVHRLFGKSSNNNVTASFSPVVDPYSSSYCLAFNMSF